MKGSQIYHRWSFITLVAALLERRVWLDRGRLGILFPNMYTILVGPPAAGKSMASGLIIDMFQQVQIPARPKPRLGPTKITQAALYKELKDSERMIPISGVGDCRSSPVFIYASELAINMVDFGGGTLTNELIDFYDSKGLRSETLKRTITEGILTLLNPSVTLLGCTTDKFLQAAAQDKLITSGLSSRILFVVEPNRVFKERNHINPDEGTYQELISRLIGVYRLIGPMQFDKQAYMRYIEAAEEADQACFDVGGEFHQNYYGRKPDHITKVAMALAAMRDSYSIGIDDIEQSIEMISEIEPNMIKAFGTRSIDSDSDVQQQICEFIPDFPKAISKSDLHRDLQKSGRFVRLDSDYDAVIRGIVTSGRITEQLIGSVWFYSKHNI